jgi:D-3-phosphoglycerate dehydrogenase
MKTLVLDEMPELFWQRINNKYPNFFITESREPENIEIIIIRTKTILSAQDLAHYPKLKMIIRAGSGFDNIDVKAALNKGIAVCTTPGANTQSAFEHTIAFILAMIKQHQNTKTNVLAGN